MARNEQLPIFADSYRLALLIELQVADFRNQICLMKASRMKQSRLYLIGFMIGVIVGATGAHADGLSDLEKLQRQIDAAKTAKQSKPAVAPAPKRKTAHVPAQDEAAPPKAAQESMTEAGAGILRQNSTGLLWTQSDNGEDIDWNEAMRYCRAKKGWRLPTRDELKRLVEGVETTPCAEFICRVSPKFRLTQLFFWTNETDGASLAWNVYLHNGGQHAHQLDTRYDQRALCVRRP